MNGSRRLLLLLARREGGESLALVRILAGAALLWNVTSAFVSGVAHFAWVDAAFGGYMPLPPEPRIELLGGPTPAVVTAVGVVAFGCGLALLAGVRPRLAALLGGQALLALTRLNPHTKGSYDSLLAAILFLSAVGDTGAAYTPFHRGRRRRRVPAYPRWLMAIQLAAVYGGTALHKLSAAWMPAGGYSALYYILQQPSWQRFDMRWAARVYPLTQVATAAVWWFELTFPVMVLVVLLRGRRGPPAIRLGSLRVDLRTPWVVFGLCLHLAIFALMEVGPFSLIILSLYPSLYPPEQVRRFTARLARVRPRAGRSAAGTSPSVS